MLKKPVWECEHCPVRKLTLVSSLKSNDLLEFQKNSYKYSMQKGQLLYSEGEKCHFLHIVMQGRVKLYYENTDGKEQIVEVISPGATFGNISLGTDNTCDTSAEAYENGIYCSISLDYYHSLVQKHPQVALHLLKTLEAQLSKSRKIIRDLSLKRARQRIASVILRLAAEDANPGFDGMEISLPLSVQTLSYMAGLTPETTSRVISELRKKDILRIKQNRLKILNYNILEKIAETS